MSIGLALNTHAVGQYFRFDPQRMQAVGHDLNAVTFLDAQLFGTGHHGFAASTGGGHEDRGKLIDGQRHEVLGNDGALQRARMHLDVGNGFGTGAAVGDFDGDGRLELVISHGESGAQPLSLYRAAAEGHNWLRVLPLTRQGAPARGALVTIRAGGRKQVRAINAGSGYLCQMEPVAHFGLGTGRAVEEVTVRWPGGAVVSIVGPAINEQLVVPYPGQ